MEVQMTITPSNLNRFTSIFTEVNGSIVTKPKETEHSGTKLGGFSPDTFRSGEVSGCHSRSEAYMETLPSRMKHVVNKATRAMWICRRMFGKTWGLSPSMTRWLYEAAERGLCPVGLVEGHVTVHGAGPAQ
ncbi:unnamed protein product [Nesidiocoris tenuis]|uniref:Uncharacterized protein n=1 Tax=Nesidiocoris tenuis TaxID=355587 RepID=A0A6H5FVL7_9HEMI|nr:unnamed protein product [Nesidiocoris tenuis]